MNLLRFILAALHLSDRAVCDMSQGRSDFHDYHDCACGQPSHFCVHRCRRRGKRYML